MAQAEAAPQWAFIDAENIAVWPISRENALILPGGICVAGLGKTIERQRENILEMHQ